MFERRRSGMSQHTTPNGGAYDTWLTPRGILSVLGKFDLDPCAAPAPQPWPTAQRMIALPEDGLEAEWSGRVWLNPPYGRAVERWLRKMALHGSGIALTFARTETAAWHRWVWPYAREVLFVAGRLSFALPDGTATKATSGAPSALIAYSWADAEVLRKAGIRGALVSRAELLGRTKFERP